MRNVIRLFVAVLMCVVLSSCSGNRPEKAFMGTWEGTLAGGAMVEISFMEDQVLMAKFPDGTIAGTWTIDPEGNAVMFANDTKTIATLVNDKKIVTRNEDGSSTVLEKKDSKKK